MKRMILAVFLPAALAACASPPLQRLAETPALLGKAARVAYTADYVMFGSK